MTLLLTRADVEPLLDLQQAIAITEKVFLEQARDAVVAIPPRHVTVPRGHLRIVSGALLETQRIGVRLSPASGGTNERAVALLYDSENGDLLCVMPYPSGTLRTGATIAVATKFLARTDARTVAMIGTGRNALSLLQAALHIRPVNRVRIYSRDAERRAAFAQRARATLELVVEAASEIEAATRGADIIYVATNSLTPVLHGDSVSSGAFVASMGRPSEIDPSIYLTAHRIVVGHKQHEEGYFALGQYRHQLLELVKDGKIDWRSVIEMCDIVAGRAPARTAAEEIIIFKESGGGFGDVAFADWIYTEARKKGLGQEWSFS
jgi:ornithine cyclodeaminase/alanine dehydrogenase-like protein (mu-crystallin family)